MLEDGDEKISTENNQDEEIKETDTKDTKLDEPEDDVHGIGLLNFTCTLQIERNHRNY